MTDRNPVNTLLNTHPECMETSLPVFVGGRQSNHGSWTLPPELVGEGVTCLWLAVATWALWAGRPVTRHDVAKTFRISPRRAADVITYLVDTRSDVVTCEREVVRVGSGHRVGTLRVTAVVSRTVQASVTGTPVRRKPTSRQNKKREESVLAAARALFLGQRVAKSNN